MLLHSSIHSALVATVCLSFAAASPLDDSRQYPKLEHRQVVNCTDPRAVTFTECWDQLGVETYLNDKSTGWIVKTPKCSSSATDSDCCKANEPWSTCFLRLASGADGEDCTTLATNKCTSLLLFPGLDSKIEPKVRYIVTAIQAINHVFTTYSSALATAPLMIDLSPVLKGTAKFNNGNLVKAITASLPFWGTPSVLAGGPQTIKSTFDPVLVHSFSESVDRSSGVSSALFGSAFNSQDSDPGVNQLQQDTRSANSNLQTALTLIMNDVTTFLHFAANGTWSGDNALSLYKYPYGNPALDTAVTTYQIGESLSQNNFYATPMGITPKASFQLDRTCTTFGDVCKDSSSKTYYWSNVTQMQYQATYKGDAYALLEYVETQTSAYMPVLFDGAYNCTLAGKAGGSTVNINADGTLDISCLSALPIYLHKGTSCPEGAVQVGGKCPFGYS